VFFNQGILTHLACKIPVKTYVFSPIFLPHSNCVAAYLQVILQLQCNCREAGAKQATITRSQNSILKEGTRKGKRIREKGTPYSPAGHKHVAIAGENSR
jgi:hypothetical protein